MTPPTLTTDRLELRPLIEADAAWIETLAGDLEVAKTTRLPHPYPPGLAAKFVARQAATPRAELNFAMIRQTDRAPLGVMGFVRFDGSWCAEIGYWVGRPYWGRGFAGEAAKALVRHGFEALGLHKIVGSCVHTNQASMRILERLGFVREGIQREESQRFGTVYDVHLFGLLQRDCEWLRSEQR
ncbi:MAG: GNAT family N-acetyltransferase [Planctomycetes bacterium]|nr:GNAT family N-acetyltransferase [Planctomycetota bacterium]MCB9911322.1 GNAT family N-acetyltransferase [Planctomycetota bacterium]MCB9912195.1 GNAT family N-acetyltransferase [Planctomycetota bacterium]HPF12981.1 GNAT family N-acetyltransferase [Planctomycetota bacterium]HRV79806.1 GNAT family N-acetyltransferase [Planctomycetota bacterium]